MDCIINGINYSIEDSFYKSNLSKYMYEFKRDHGVSPQYKDTLKYIIFNVLIKFNYLKEEDLTPEFMQAFSSKFKGNYLFYLNNYERSKKYYEEKEAEKQKVKDEIKDDTRKILSVNKNSVKVEEYASKWDCADAIMRLLLLKEYPSHEEKVFYMYLYDLQVSACLNNKITKSFWINYTDEQELMDILKCSEYKFKKFKRMFTKSGILKFRDVEENHTKLHQLKIDLYNLSEDIL